MTPQQRQLVEDWFDRLADANRIEAEARLNAECPDAAVREEVLRLLRASAETRDVADNLRDELETFAQSLSELAPGTKVGAYEIIETLGAGGMGSVYRAKQEFTNQIVALKLIKAGLLGPAMVRRFLFEVEILGKLNHPGVARVYEAGLADTPRGRQPFFAMEFIEGRALDEYVKQTELPRNGVIELLRKVAEAVAHAHSRGVIHRDLKPANVVVSADGTPKVLDFGVARAVSGNEKATVHSEAGGIIGTPSYMAPEQLSGSAGEVDADTDVYALGVIAYELLCGRRPHDLSGKTLVEMTRIVCEYEPPRPATINRTLRGDLETIILKALEKDKSRRYPTAAELAEDLRRLLANEPILARPATQGYRMRKFVARHKGGVLATSLVAVALIGALVTTAWGLYRTEKLRRLAEAERDNVEAVLNFLTNDIIAAAEPQSSRGRAISVQEAIAKASERIGKDFANRPRVEARIRQSIARALRSMGKPQEALPHAIRSVELAKRSDVNDAELLANCSYTLGQVYQGLGEFDEAATMMQEVVDASRKRLGPDHRDTIEAEAELNIYLCDLRIHDALKLAQELQERTKGRTDLGDETRMQIKITYALALAKTKPSKFVVELLRSNLKESTQLLGEDHPMTLSVMNILGGLMGQSGMLKEAEEVMRKELEIKTRVVGPNHSDTLDCVLNLSSVLFFRGKSEEAEQLMIDGLERAQRHLPPQHPIVIRLTGNLSGVYAQTGRADKALPMKRTILQDTLTRFGEKNEATLVAMNGLAQCLYQLPGHEAETEEVVRRMFVIRREFSGEDSTFTYRDAFSLAKSMFDNKKHEEAIAFLEPFAEKIITRNDQPRELAEPMVQFLAEAYAYVGRNAEAEAVLKRAGVDPAEESTTRPTTRPRYPTR